MQAAAWVVKLQPSIDSLILLHMMQHGITLVKQVGRRIVAESPP